MNEKRLLHCWQDGPVHYELWEHPSLDMGVGSMCMLVKGHAGPHEFTRNDDIQVKFVEEKDW